MSKTSKAFYIILLWIVVSLKLYLLLIVVSLRLYNIKCVSYTYTYLRTQDNLPTRSLACALAPSLLFFVIIPRALIVFWCSSSAFLVPRHHSYSVSLSFFVDLVSFSFLDTILFSLIILLAPPSLAPLVHLSCPWYHYSRTCNFSRSLAPYMSFFGIILFALSLVSCSSGPSLAFLGSRTR